MVVFPTAERLAEAVAERLVDHAREVLSERGEVSIVLTGGTIANQLYRSLLHIAPGRSLDWSRVELWWGDERFLPAGHPDRNETQARAALLDAVPLDPARVHPMPASDGDDGDDPDAAARRYEALLAASAGPAGVRPGALARPRQFDVALLGIGEDGHVASLFPSRPERTIKDRWVAAVRDSPKPPPVRLSLTIPAINAARQIWLVAAGAKKAEAIDLALRGEPLPASIVRGVERTIWLLDSAARGFD